MIEETLASLAGRAPQRLARWCVVLGLLVGWISARAQEEVWIGTASSTWEVGSNWLDGTAPAGGSLPLRFTASGATAFTATAEMLYSIQQLVLDSTSTGMMTLASAGPGELRFFSTNPTIEITGTGPTTISATTALYSVSGSTTITGAGGGNLTLSGNIIGDGRLVIDADAPSPNLQTITLSGLNRFGADVELKSGNLVVGHTEALGSSALRVSGGTLRLTSGLSVSNPIDLAADLVVQALSGISSSTYHGVISSVVPGTGLTLRSAGSTLVLTNNSVYTGVTTVAGGLAARDAQLAAGTLSLSGGGSARNSSAFEITQGGRLALAGDSTGVSNRISDATPVRLRSAELSFSSVTGAATQTETVGTLSGEGAASVVVTPSFTVNARLTANALERVNRGTFLFRGNRLGNAFASDVANILFTTAPAGLIGGGGSGPNTSILPYAVGVNPVSSSSETFVTYSTDTGIRPLTSAEFATTLATAAPTNNVRLGASVTSAAATVNALSVSNITVSGAALTITSGALLGLTGSGSVGIINNPIEFGSREGNIYVTGELQLRGVVSGSGGLTKSGAGTLTLSAANGFTGPLTINAGNISITNLATLGPETTPITFAAQFGGLVISDSSIQTLSRDLISRGGLARITTNGVLTHVGTITGSGGMRWSGAATARIFWKAQTATWGRRCLRAARRSFHPTLRLARAAGWSSREGVSRWPATGIRRVKFRSRSRRVLCRIQRRSIPPVFRPSCQAS